VLIVTLIYSRIVYEIIGSDLIYILLEDLLIRYLRALSTGQDGTAYHPFIHSADYPRLPYRLTTAPVKYNHDCSLQRLMSSQEALLHSMHVKGYPLNSLLMNVTRHVLGEMICAIERQACAAQGRGRQNHRNLAIGSSDPLPVR
jgi:hypothetical protein